MLNFFLVERCLLKSYSTKAQLNAIISIFLFNCSTTEKKVTCTHMIQWYLVYLVEINDGITRSNLWLPHIQIPGENSSITISTSPALTHTHTQSPVPKAVYSIHIINKGIDLSQFVTDNLISSNVIRMAFILFFRPDD